MTHIPVSDAPCACLSNRDNLADYIPCPVHDENDTASCAAGIHGWYQRTPNGLCPWCEWEALEQRVAHAAEVLAGAVRPTPPEVGAE